MPDPYAGLSTAMRHRLDGLLARMTLEEKAGQLSLFAPADAASVNPTGPSLGEAAQLEEIRAGRVTGLFNNHGLEGKRRAQETAVNESRLGIPLLFAADVIHGFHTIFPVPLAEAASWDPSLAERTARAAAQEATADGFRWTFAPMVDIARDARWGRGIEGSGEDVLLGCRFAQARVRGFQGPRLDAPDAMLATPKHFAAYGAAEGGLDYNTVDISERTLREVYLPPFRAAFDAGAMSVMTAFNEIAGVPSNANPALLDGLLRREWGFGGLVVSDYTADEELVAHGIAADARDATRLAFLAGSDMSMQSGLYLRHLPGLVRAGEVPMARLDEAVRRVLATKARLGLFDHPFRGLGRPGTADAPRPPDAATLRALAREAARRSVVLLKNEGELLPLARDGRRLALIGPFIDSEFDVLGPWSLFPRPAQGIGLADGLREVAGAGTSLRLVRGSGVDAPLPGGLDEAVQAARDADVVLLALGENNAMSGEARSRTEIGLPRAQQALAEAVAATGKPLVVLLRNGRALALEGAVRDARAILVTWFLGHEAGPAVAELLFGVASPSGRLPVSFPQRPGQVPYYYAHKRTGRPQPPEQPEAFYKARYLDSTHAPLYPFGHGLGYAPVRYVSLALSSGARLSWDGSLTLTTQLRNEGAREVEEVVQLYIAPRRASVTRPVRELKDFQRVRLGPGQVVEVQFSLRRADLQWLGPTLQPQAEPGRFDAWVAPSATTGLSTSFELLPPGH